MGMPPDDLGGSDVSAPYLLALNGLEQRFEVSRAETERAVPLDEFEEPRARSFAHR
jgi:hypothetical protein